MFTDDKRITPKVEAAFHAAIAKYAQRPEVTGIGIGFKVKGGNRLSTLAIRIHVREKHASKYLSARERFPKTIRGVPVDVIEASYAHEVGDMAGQLPDSSWTARTSASGILRPGLSISHEFGRAGTLGLVLRDRRTGQPCLLSAAHVLADHPNFRPGDPIVQPAREDGGTRAVGRFIRLNRDTDSAFAVLEAGVDTDSAQLGSNITVSRARFPSLGDVLEKSGRTTKVTRALVEELGVIGGVRFAMRLGPLDPEARPLPPIARPGDSGSIWYDPATGAGVGLHCRGLAAPNGESEVAIASSLRIVMDFLELDFPGTD
jgi:endonuclease G, mitochondrial